MQRITILVENRVGVIAEITQLMAKHDINILSLEGYTDHGNGTVHLDIEQYDRALRLLQQAGFRAISEDALVISVVDESGGLAKVANRLKDHQINIITMHILERKMA